MRRQLKSRLGIAVGMRKPGASLGGSARATGGRSHWTTRASDDLVEYCRTRSDDWPNVVRNRANLGSRFGQARANISRFGRGWPESGRYRPNLGKVWPGSGHIWQTPPTVGRTRPYFARYRSEFEPNSLKSTNNCPFRLKVARTRRQPEEFGQIRIESGQVWAEHRRRWGDAERTPKTHPMLGQLVMNFARDAFVLLMQGRQ